MAHYEFRLPDVGEGVSEAEIVQWHVQPGDVVAEDQPMVEVMSDKATVTIDSPRAGRILELRFEVGATAQVGQVLVVIEPSSPSTSPGSISTPASGPVAASQGAAASGVTASASASPKEAATASGETTTVASAVGDIREGLPGASYFTRNAKRADSSNGGHAHKPLATPATRKLARDLGVDLADVVPSGAEGRITSDDVRAHVGPKTRESGRALAPNRRTSSRVRSGRATGERIEERKPFVGVRRKIASRMQLAKQTAAHFTFVEECSADRLIALRDALQPAAEAQGLKLSFLPFILKAVVDALETHPVLNSTLDESTNELVYKKYYDIGIAVATEQGLMVPVLRNADQRPLLDIAREIDRLSEGARTGRLTPSELTGSTFTITSLGKKAGLFATPVLNFPEVGILGIHRIKQKPVVRDGQLAIGNVMLLSLSFDHRIVDGHVGAEFAYHVIDYLEQPERMFIDAI